MKDLILNFIRRRFPTDSNWVNGNCYYFAMILKERFSKSAIVYYDVVQGHFVTRIGEDYYDYTGLISVDEDNLVEWSAFKDYDAGQFRRIMVDCIL